MRVRILNDVVVSFSVRYDDEALGVLFVLCTIGLPPFFALQSFPVNVVNDIALN